MVKREEVSYIPSRAPSTLFRLPYSVTEFPFRGLVLGESRQEEDAVACSGAASIDEKDKCKEGSTFVQRRPTIVTPRLI